MLYQELILLDDDYYQELIRTIEKAKRSIDLEVYTFENDELGNQIADSLCLAALRGVNIRIIVDGIGTPNWGNALTKKLRSHNIETRIYHPMPWVFAHWEMTSHSDSSFMIKLKHFVTHINARNHRKICIIDNNIVLVGSANISRCYVKHKTGLSTWRDTSVKIINVRTLELSLSFEKVWNERRFLLLTKKILNHPKIDPVFRLNDTFRRRFQYYHSLLKTLKKCEQRIWITNAYFLPNKRILNALVKAAKRKVDVKIILPEKTDVVLSGILAKTFYSILINAGVKIYEYLPKILHAKTLIIDDIYYVGSSNINFRSIRHDLEVDVKITTNEAKITLQSAFLNDLSNSKIITYDEALKQSFFIRLMGRLLLFLKYWF